MYSLPLSADEQQRVPFQGHTAFLVVTGLLHDDLDDRMDALRGALEIDPLFAAWTVCTASQRQSADLSTIDAACRWLSTSLLHTIDPSELLTRVYPESAANRATWRNVARKSVRTARRAQQIGDEQLWLHFWLTMLITTKRQLDAFTQLNGHSPLPGFSITWPKWLIASEETLNDTDSPSSLHRNISQALSAPDETLEPLVTDEETSLWFRQYPEFQHLAPSMLKKLQRLNSLDETFEETLQREKLASLQQLAYGASHEINNPLANISTRAQTLVYHEHDDDRRKKLLAINDQAFRAYEMLADLMLFAKPPELELADVSIDRLLRDLRDEILELALAQETELQLNVEPSLADVRSDPTQIAIAIKAICVNGLESIVSGGSLAIEATATDTHVRITVEDSGAGLSESAQRHLFDPFFSGREAGRGLGFGLSKAWRIVEQHHGRITVDSQTGRGSRFTVTLPIAGPASPSSNATAKPNEQRQVDASPHA